MDSCLRRSDVWVRSSPDDPRPSTLDPSTPYARIHFTASPHVAFLPYFKMPNR
jgi:hypothetical protein